MVLKEQTMVRIQKIQRQPRYCITIPPKRGPNVGPRRGPRRYHPKTPLNGFQILDYNESEITNASLWIFRLTLFHSDRTCR